MKRFHVLAATTVLTFAIGAVAQHGRPAGAGATGGSHASMHQPASHQPPAHSGAPGSSSQGRRTMDAKLTDTKLGGKIADLTGMSATDACNGFKNLGQCVAAAHVAKNLNLTFVDLKNTVLGLNPDGTPSTTAKPMSLGKAIQTLAPTADANAEVKKANQQASTDTQSAGS